MKLSRNITTKIHYILDNFVPPVIRDSKFFMYIPFRIMFGKKMWIFLNFKEKAKDMSKEDFKSTNMSILDVLVDRMTDLNEACIKEILRNIKGESVLEVGCGKGFLAKLLAVQGLSVTGMDLIVETLQNVRKNINKNVIKNVDKNINFVSGDAEDIPFLNKKFDTVICTHTLEHVQNLSKTISELRRVVKKRLIIVVPKQRSYKYTFDLHLHFFPYIETFIQVMGKSHKQKCVELGGDIYYQEDY